MRASPLPLSWKISLSLLPRSVFPSIIYTSSKLCRRGRDRIRERSILQLLRARRRGRASVGRCRSTSFGRSIRICPSRVQPLALPIVNSSGANDITNARPAAAFYAASLDGKDKRRLLCSCMYAPLDSALSNSVYFDSGTF